MLPDRLSAPAGSVGQSLRALAADVRGLERSEVRERVLAACARLRSGEGRGEGTAPVDAAIGLCRALHAQALPAEAMIVADALLEHATADGSPVALRRARMLCGIAHADAGDSAGAIEHNVATLKLAAAEGNDEVLCKTWNNIGLVMSHCGQYQLAIRCFERAVELAQSAGAPAHGRNALVNLAHCHYHLGDHAAGLASGHRALALETARLRDADPLAAIFLRRNLVSLLVAVGRIAEGHVHADECAALADRLQSPRGYIATAITRSLLEVADGHTDMALTRLESALSRARAVPAVLHDTLACIVRAEEAAGNVERALLRLQELAEHTYRFAIDKARAQLELESFVNAGLPHSQRQVEARLLSRIPAPRAPTGWAALDRLGVTAAMRMDQSGWHGKRVGVLVKSLALAQGSNPLQAVELGLAAELHDVGMLSVPEGVLQSSQALSEAQLGVVRKHIDAGAEMLPRDSHPRLHLAREMASYHHARWDGGGYPQGVAGAGIPLAARLCAIADAYDAIVCGLGATPPRPMQQALGELRQESGGQFDPGLVERFEEMVRSETADLGVELEGAGGMADFQQFIHSLQEDRGFV